MHPVGSRSRIVRRQVDGADGTAIYSKLASLARVAERAAAHRAVIVNRLWRRAGFEPLWTIFVVTYLVFVVVAACDSASRLPTLSGWFESIRTMVFIAIASGVLLLRTLTDRLVLRVFGRLSVGKGQPRRLSRLGLLFVAILVSVFPGSLVWADLTGFVLYGLLPPILAFIVAALAFRVAILTSRKFPYLAVYALNLARPRGRSIVDDRIAFAHVVRWLERVGWRRQAIRQVEEIVRHEVKQVEVRLASVDVLIAFVALIIVVLGPSVQKLIILDPSVLAALGIIVIVGLVGTTLWYVNAKLKSLDVLKLMLCACISLERDLDAELENAPKSWINRLLRH